VATATPITTLIIDDEQLARQELRYLLDSAGGVDVLAEGSNGIEAVNLIEQHRPELVFLDVQMPGMDGFAVIKQLIDHHQLARLPQFIFATAYDQYAVRAFDVNAADYLLKPFDANRIRQALDRVRVRLTENALENNAGNGASALSDERHLQTLLELLNRQPAPRPPAPSKLVVQVQTRLLLVDQSDICFASIEDGVIRVVTPTLDGQSKCRTLEDLLELLDPALFWRAHRGFVVNINHIREVVPWFKSSYLLRMDDRKQTEIPVSHGSPRATLYLIVRA